MRAKYLRFGQRRGAFATVVARKSEGPLDHLPVLLVEVRIIRQQLSTSCVGVGGILFYFLEWLVFFSPNKEEMWRQERGEEREAEGEQTPVAVRCHSHSQPCVSSSRGVTRLIKPTIMTQTRDEPRQRSRFSLWCLFYNKKNRPVVGSKPSLPTSCLLRCRVRAPTRQVATALPSTKPFFRN